MTQGDPLSPTLFNVVVDAVVWHWLEGLQKDKDEKEAEGGEGHFSAVYYADDGMVGATDPQWLQGAFSALVAIFDRVGLLTNGLPTLSGGVRQQVNRRIQAAGYGGGAIV